MDQLLRILGLYIILNEEVRMCMFVGICTIASNMGILKKHMDTKQNIYYGCMYWPRVFSGNVETTDISIGVCLGIVCTLTYFCHVPYVIFTKYIM